MRYTSIVVIASLACHPGAERPAHLAEDSSRLPAADSAYAGIDATFVFQLPDSGGFIINGQVVARDSIPGNLRFLFDHRRPNLRAVMVFDNPRRRRDVHWIAEAATLAGGRAFDAELSGWPTPPPGWGPQ